MSIVAKNKLKKFCGRRSKVWRAVHRRRPIAIIATHKRMALGCLAWVKTRGATFQWTFHNSHHDTLMANKPASIFLRNQLVAQQYYLSLIRNPFCNYKTYVAQSICIAPSTQAFIHVPKTRNKTKAPFICPLSWLLGGEHRYAHRHCLSHLHRTLRTHHKGATLRYPNGAAMPDGGT